MIVLLTFLTFIFSLAFYVTAGPIGGTLATTMLISVSVAIVGLLKKLQKATNERSATSLQFVEKVGGMVLINSEAVEFSGSVLGFGYGHLTESGFTLQVEGIENQ